MAQGTLALKSRIKSVISTSKITKAMQLVAASKYQKLLVKMQNNRLYANEIIAVFNKIGKYLDQNNPFLHSTSDKVINLVFCSDMGLCGSYNLNIQKEISKLDPNKNDFIVVGTRILNWMKNNNYNVLSSYSSLKDNCYTEISLLVNEIIKLYRDGKYGKFNLIATKFINSLTFETNTFELLPLKLTEQVQELEISFEPNADSFLENNLLYYLSAISFSFFLESRTSEQSSRRSAMETASDNADEIREKLELKYNQARQSAITQEITEIVAGANAL